MRFARWLCVMPAVGAALVVGALSLWGAPAVAASPSLHPSYTSGPVKATYTRGSFGGAKTGYWEVAADGQVFSFGDVVDYTPEPPVDPASPIVGGARTSDGGGYWLVGKDGGVLTYGDAHYYGSMGGKKLNKPIVGMAATPGGGGYWLVASDGGIFSFGDAKFYGSTGSLVLNRPVVGMTATPSGGGYWLDASDGGIFSFGDAVFHGSTGGLVLNKPVVGMTATPDGGGYWLDASDGGIFSFGDAGFHGSTGSLALVAPVVGMAATSDGGGYWLVAADGGVFTFGDAEFDGSAGGALYPAKWVAVLPQTAPVGNLLAAPPIAGTWYAHGTEIAIGTDGRFGLQYRTYNFCNSPDMPRLAGPCDYLAANLIIAGGHAGGRIVSIADTATGQSGSAIITYDPGHAFAGKSPVTVKYDSASDTLTLGTFTFCGPRSPAGTCGA